MSANGRLKKFLFSVLTDISALHSGNFVQAVLKEIAMIKLPRRSKSPMERRPQAGYSFMIPLILGLLFIFIPSVYKTIVFSLNEITITGEGYTLDFRGIEFFKEALLENAQILPLIWNSLKTLLVNIPIILIFSLFIATILNQKFHGRLLARVIFFIPVLLSVGIIIRYDTALMNMVSSTVDTGSDSAMASLGNFSSLLSSLNFNKGLTDIVVNAVSNIYDVVKASGIQIFIFLAGLQEINPALYEAASVEGCNKWELFWKITFPMILPQMTINAVYTIVDSYTNSNGIFRYIQELSSQQQYSLATATSLLYLLCLGVVIALVLGLLTYFQKKIS